MPVSGLWQPAIILHGANRALARLMEASKPVIQRMTIDYRNLLHDAYFRLANPRVFRSRRDPKLPMPNRVAAMPTGGAWPSYYVEEHQSNAHTMAAQLTSLVLEGIPERFPKVKIVFIEGGFGWIPSATWRMDRHFESFRSEVPHLKCRPSEYVKEHFWFTTQPIDEPDEAMHLRSLIEWVGADRLLFSSDYPHWDFDDPRFAFKTPLTETERRKIFNGNARTLYKL
jgi:predicted TIM-barrel fold metal-dependent hydrolase